MTSVLLKLIKNFQLDKFITIHKTHFFVLNISLICLCTFPIKLFCIEQAVTNTEENQSSPLTKETPKAPKKVSVNPKTYDSEISKRLEDIMKATGWFENSKVQVKDGVVFLEATTKTEEIKKWAEELASNTQDTVAVVNYIKVKKPSIWEFKPVIEGLKNQWISLLRIIPTIIFGLLIFVITLIISRFIIYLSYFFLSRRFYNPLIQQFIAWSIGFIVMLIGLYIISNLMGLTTIALTVIGGTGLLGIILGIAFKDITENFLASLFLSFNNPFQTGDLIEILGILAYVDRLTFRSTILIKLDGTYVQIPNSTIYKSNIQNYTSNPNHREDFLIGIGFENQISDAQEAALKILNDHPAILKIPEPWVLVDSLGKAVVYIRIYFWINRQKHSWLKVRSSVIRLIKGTFQSEGISMPDEDRERIFPEGITVRLASKSSFTEDKFPGIKPQKQSQELATEGEGELQSEEKYIKEQALNSSVPDKGRNLLGKENITPKN
ncbi:MAG: mechanosensitive ion channel [Parachlamydiaceae bacterium]|nr:mechanosensitive ion channel [Parachlamydiaceae bacterium]